MSLIPMLFSDWWEDLDRPHRLADQYFATTINPDDLVPDLEPYGSTRVMVFRPNYRRNRQRYHPFSRDVTAATAKGTSTVQANKSEFQVTLDVSQFKPDEVNVKVVGQNIVIEAKHEEKEDEHGWVSRQFVRKYIIPSQCDIDRVESRLSSDGILTITVPRKRAAKPEIEERPVKIQFTGKPALSNADEQTNSIPNNTQEPQKEQQQRRQQQQQPHRKKMPKNP